MTPILTATKRKIALGAVLAALVTGGAYFAVLKYQAWLASFRAEQQREIAENLKEVSRPRTDEELFSAAIADIPQQIDLNNPAPFEKAHVELQELMSRFPQSTHFSAAKDLDGQVSGVVQKLNALEVLMADADARNQGAFASGVHEYRRVLGDTNIAELQHYMDSYSAIPEKSTDFTAYHKLYSTTLEAGDRYAVTAYYDRTGIELCDQRDRDGDCMGHYLLARTATPDTQVLSRLYDLHGKLGCFVVMKGEAEFALVMNGFPGTCEAGALKDNLLYLPNLKVDNVVLPSGRGKPGA